eukprot:1195791-Prorocentrum_minimum.AAC.9
MCVEPRPIFKETELLPPLPMNVSYMWPYMTHLRGPPGIAGGTQWLRQSLRTSRSAPRCSPAAPSTPRRSSTASSACAIRVDGVGIRVDSMGIRVDGMGIGVDGMSTYAGAPPQARPARGTERGSSGDPWELHYKLGVLQLCNCLLCTASSACAHDGHAPLLLITGAMQTHAGMCLCPCVGIMGSQLQTESGLIRVWVDS